VILAQMITLLSPEKQVVMFRFWCACFMLCWAVLIVLLVVYRRNVWSETKRFGREQRKLWGRE